MKNKTDSCDSRSRPTDRFISTIGGGEKPGKYFPRKTRWERRYLKKCDAPPENAFGQASGGEKSRDSPSVGTKSERVVSIRGGASRKKK